VAVDALTIDMMGARLLDEIGESRDLTLVRGPSGENDPFLHRARGVLSQRIYAEIGLERLASAQGDTAVLCSGEGWRRRRDQLLPHILGVAELRFRRLIVLPTRFDTSEDEIREALTRTRATVFAADRSTYARIVSLCDARLAEDEDGAQDDAEHDATPEPGDGLRALSPPSRNGHSATAPVTAVILTRDRPEPALRAIDSVRRGTCPARVLVIDNNSSAAAAAELRRALSGYEDVSLWRSERNLGCAGGRQLGIELTDSPLLLLLDDDAELAPDALELLAAELDAHPDALAVTATVATPDGVVQHSGGWVEISGGVAEFTLLGAGQHLSDPGLAPSGPAGWVPGTALLARRAALEDFPIDADMAGYYEDNEWCYRVALARPGSLRRSREAHVIHDLSTEHPPGRDFASRAKAVRLLEPHARFYRRHGQLLGPTVFNLVPELRDPSGRWDAPAARLLMELLIARGQDWVLMEWMNGGLDALLHGGIERAEAERVRSENQNLRAELQARESLIAAHAQELTAHAEHMRFLQERHEMLQRILDGGWWRLRQRLLPLLRALGRIRRGI
jgi:GT2 family glycosyltransferase